MTSVSSFQHVVVNSLSHSAPQQHLTLGCLFPFGIDRRGEPLPIQSPQEWSYTVATLKGMLERCRDAPSERKRLQQLLDSACEAYGSHDDYSAWLQSHFGNTPTAEISAVERERFEDEFRMFRERKYRKEGSSTLPNPAAGRRIERALESVLTTVHSAIEEDGHEACSEEVQRWAERVRSSPAFHVPKGHKFDVAVEVLPPQSAEDAEADIFTSQWAPDTVHSQFIVRMLKDPAKSGNSKASKKDPSPVSIVVQQYATNLLSTAAFSDAERCPTPRAEPYEIAVHLDHPVHPLATCRSFMATVEHEGERLPMVVKRLALSSWEKPLRKAILSEVAAYHNCGPHENIATVYGHVYDRDSKELKVAVEHVAGNDGAQLTLPLPESVAKSILRCVLSAITHLESKGIALPHVPLSRLVGIGSGSGLKVIPTTVSECVAHGADPLLPPELRLAEKVPENKNHASAPLTCRASTWALGVLALQLLTGSVTHSAVPLMPLNVSALCQDFLHQCNEEDPVARWTCKDVASHAFLGVKKSKLRS